MLQNHSEQSPESARVQRFCGQSHANLAHWADLRTGQSPAYSCPVTSLRAQKKRDTAEGLAEAAYDLAASRGFDAVTTDDIAAKAGVSRRTFANYYQNKHAAVVDGFVHHLGITIHHPVEPIADAQIAATFDELIAQTHSFITAVFTDNSRISHIQDFARMVKENPGLEPYVHAVFLEFQNSNAHKVLAERFGEVKVSLFLGAVIGSLAGIVRLILGPLAIPRGTPPLRGGATATPDDAVPVLTASDISEFLAHIDLAFTYLRRGFADR